MSRRFCDIIKKSEFSAVMLIVFKMANIKKKESFERMWVDMSYMPKRLKMRLLRFILKGS